MEPDGSINLPPDEWRTSNEARKYHRQLEGQGHELYGEQDKGKNDEVSEGDKGNIIDISHAAANKGLLKLENYE